MTEEPLTRLSVRRGVCAPEEPYRGVPGHLQVPLQQWAATFLALGHRGEDYDQRRLNVLRLANLSRIKLPNDERQNLNTLVTLASARYNPENVEFFDVVDMHLRVFGTGQMELAELLRDGGSIWTVSETPVRLEERVPEEQREAYVLSTMEGDDAAEQLREAWGKVYGRDPNPSDAWDHAIKAVEFLLHRLVLPKNDRATLGSMSSALLDKPAKWTLLLETAFPQLGEVEVFAGMLKLMWGNPDRHGSGTGFYRNPTPDEAEQIVGMAVLVVSWLRKSALQLAAAPSIRSAASS